MTIHNHDISLLWALSNYNSWLYYDTAQPDLNYSIYKDTCVSKMYVYVSGFQNVTNTFDINPDTGVITTKHELDRETTPWYLLCIQASKPDSSGRKKRDTQSEAQVKATMVENLNRRTNHKEVLYLLVNVADANDNGPTFTDKLLKTGRFIMTDTWTVMETSLMM